LSPRQLFRLLAVAEAITWTLLILGMLLKYAVRTTDVGVSIGGAVHGFVFLAFVVGALVIALNQRWSLVTTGMVLLSAVLPYATIPGERRLERENLLDGGWRIAPTDDPRDSSQLNRGLFWVLNHPILSFVVAIGAVVVVFILLLIVGPPVGG
jgi:integral membrane protein